MTGGPSRVGVAVLDSDVVIEPELAALFGGTPSVHWARVGYPGGVTPDALAQARRSLLTACASLAKVSPELIVYGCTSGSFFAGPEATAALERDAGRAAGVPVVTASTAVRHALGRLGVRRIGLVTPYSVDVTARLVQFLAAGGTTVDGIRCLFGDRPVTDAELQAASLDVIADGCRAVAPGAEAVLVSCTGMRALHGLADLEAELGLPVLSSNAAIARYLLDRTGTTVPRAGDGSHGRLLALPTERIPSVDPVHPVTGAGDG